MPGSTSPSPVQNTTTIYFSMELQNTDTKLEHTEACKTLPINKRCKSCINHYKREYYRRTRQEEKSKLIKTRNNSKRSKYADILCSDCKDKTFKNYCRPCYLNYERVRYKYRKHKCKIKSSKPNKVQQMYLESNENSNGGNTSNSHVKKVKKESDKLRKVKKDQIKKKKNKSVNKTKLIKSQSHMHDLNSSLTSTSSKFCAKKLLQIKSLNLMV